jgi:DNA invertase Pin-like site-specific DNA recombinase
MISRPYQIADRHLGRRAVAYVRQSSPEQVRANIGSTAVQRDLAGKLEAWSWPSTMIEVLDDDLGISGSRAGARDGFNNLLERMKAGEVGLVAVVDASRLSRNVLDLFGFVDRAQRYDVLLAQGDQVIDFNDPNSLFIGGVLGLNAIRDNGVRVNLSVQARRKKAEAGIAPTTPPVGYVRRPDGGGWSKDPDLRVQEVIALIFDKLHELGSMRRVVRYLRSHNIQVPRRRWRDRERWQDANYDHVAGFATNPVYAGRYIFGQTRQERPPEGSRKRGRQQPRPMTEWVAINDHHEPYIDPARWEEIQKRIAANRLPARSPIGGGKALLQGILRCHHHHVTFHTRYDHRVVDADGRIERWPRYICQPHKRAGDSRGMHTVRAALLDAVVERQLLETLTPVALGGIEEAVQLELRQFQALTRGRQDEIRRAEHSAAEAERAYLHADPAHKHLTQRLSERLDQALQELERVRAFHRLHPLVPPLTPDADTLAELRELLHDLPRLWRHPTVTHEQRKQVLRAVVKAVHLTPTPDTWPLEVEWVGGARTVIGLTRQDRAPARPTSRRRPRLGLTRRRPLLIPLATYQLIREQMAAGVPAQAMADMLNAAAVLHHRGPWTTKRVHQATSRIRHGHVPGVEPPSPLPTLTDHVGALHAQGLTAPTMVTALQSRGIKTRHRTDVSEAAVHAAMKRLRLRAHSRLMNETVHAYLREWSGSTPLSEIAARLNALGLTTRHGRSWTSANVREKARDMGVLFVHQRAPATTRTLELTRGLEAPPA